VKLTTLSVIGPEYLDTIFARSITFCFALSLVYGGAWKYVASIAVHLFWQPYILQQGCQYRHD